jgi:hypothetical protein
MTQTIKETLDLRTEVPPEPECPRVSRLAKCALGFGAVSALSGLLSFGSGPIKSGWMTPEIPDALACAIATSVMTGIAAVFLAVTAAIRIGSCRDRLRGYGLCLWGAGLAVIGTIFWFFAVGMALA